MKPDLIVEGSELRWGELRARLDDVSGFNERYGVWSGRVWLEIEGPGWKIPVREGYGEVRGALRAALPALPFESDWMDGRFPCSPAGIPSAWTLAMGIPGIALPIVGASLVGGTFAALAVAFAALWPLGHLRSRLVITRSGIYAGPPWSPMAPWHEVTEACVRRGKRWCRVWLRGPAGGGSCSVPTRLLPAVRARLWRLGGLRLVDDPMSLDDRYLRWRGPATGVPWGVMVATVTGAWFVEDPWIVLTVGLVVVAGLALLGAAVQARVTGWGAGAVGFMSLLYALILISLSIGFGGWLGNG